MEGEYSINLDMRCCCDLYHPLVYVKNNHSESNHVAGKCSLLLKRHVVCVFFFTLKPLLKASLGTLRLINDYMENDLQSAGCQTAIKTRVNLINL